MEKRGSMIGDVRPENILLNEDGEFKLISVHSWPGNPDNNQLFMEEADSRVFLCSNCLIQLQNNVFFTTK